MAPTTVALSRPRSFVVAFLLALGACRPDGEDVSRPPAPGDSSVVILARQGPAAGGGAPRPRSNDRADEGDGLAPVQEVRAPVRDPLPAACGLAVTEVALYQGVKVPLANEGGEISPRPIEVVEARAALVRVFVTPGPGWGAGEALARLLVRTPEGVKAYDQAKKIGAASTEGALASTLNFDVSGADLTSSAAIAIELYANCAGETRKARFPEIGEVPLRPVRTGVLKVKLVPLRYEADGSNRLPDTSDAQLERFRALLYALYPVQGVEISLRAPVGTRMTLTDESGWPDLLDALRAIRVEDAAPPDVYYYGLVNPAETGAAYCKGSCTAGIAYRAPVGVPSARVGVGIGYPGTASAEALAHELGHEHGRLHAPCGGVKDGDPSFPHAGGGTGGWGFDMRTRTLVDPARSRDIMGYCGPRWVSDYTWKALVARSAAVNVPSPLLAAQVAGEETAWRALLLDGAGRPRWGLPFVGPAHGTPEAAEILDEAGRTVATVDVYRTEVSDSDEFTLLVPTPRVGWHGVRVRGAPPLAFGAAPAVQPLRP